MICSGPNPPGSARVQERVPKGNGASIRGESFSSAMSDRQAGSAVSGRYGLIARLARSRDDQHERALSRAN
jgi:hypothetical protein